MNLALALPLCLVFACGSSAPSGGDDTAPDAGAGSGSASAAGWKLEIGQPYESSKPVTIAPVKTNGVYAGYFEARSAADTVPDLLVSIHAPNAMLSAGMSVPCARSTSSNSFDETSVLAHWLDGDTYYTNVTGSPSCTIKITAASQTSISATITGSIVDEMDTSHASTPFTASFTAAVTN